MITTLNFHYPSAVLASDLLFLHNLLPKLFYLATKHQDRLLMFSVETIIIGYITKIIFHLLSTTFHK